MPNIDQAVPGDGRWEIDWQLMQCDVGATNFYYSFQGSNPTYIKMQVVNSRSAAERSQRHHAVLPGTQQECSLCCLTGSRHGCHCGPEACRGS